MERRLAAVMIADVAGYSRLSRADEEGTRARFLSDLNEVFEPLISQFHGRLVKTMGDGLLVEFPSVVDALRCAVEVQRAKAERDRHAPPEQRLNFRIGVNIGDVIVEGNDIHGDGVNIADRIQTLAEPGGTAISGTAYDHVKDKVPFALSALGEQKVKNIPEPVRVYHVADRTTANRSVASTRNGRRRYTWLALAAVAMVGIVLTALTWRQWHLIPSSYEQAGATQPSLAVLPFDTMGDSQQQAYLADGFSEDLTTALARIPGVFVVSRNAAFAYKDRTVQPTEISKKLGVRYLLEGSIRRLGDDIRINAQLIDGESAGHLWAERFDGQWSDVFTLQDTVVDRIAGALKLRLVSSQGKTGTAGGTNDPIAYEAYLRGSELEGRGTPDAIVDAEALYKQALTLDPAFGAAAAALASLYWNADDARSKALGLSWKEIVEKRGEALRMAARYPSPTYYQVSADLLVRERKSDEAIKLLQRAIPLNPSDDWTYVVLSDALNFNGRPREARAYLDAAMRVDPGWTDWRHYQAGLAEFGQGRFKEAIDALERINPDSPSPWPRFFGQHLLLSAYGHLGHPDKARSVKRTLEALVEATDGGELCQLVAQQYFVYMDEADMLRLLDGLTKAGVSALPSSAVPKLGDRLSGPEVRSLVTGHTLAGREIAPTVSDFGLTIWPNGKFNAFFGPDGVSGTVWVQGDFLCTATAERLTNCAAVFRNPVGSAAQRNEYRAVFRWSQLEFSVIN
ncbi:adenylate/guanylate cyclase domain-containing protein [Arvimicrobium flavum]|uniref:adenylate/guanylate cyclase domain-containing protein n=1 Tax=Arvimicrobium flavum TaxID=3393320 RepID=UPI00237BBBD0|nr:adenylate/guanylate cyclase domain-containing protein [Mesorhizobium shangrilense]